MRLHPVDSILYILLRFLKALDRRKTDLEHFDPTKVKRILIVSSTAIGDTLLSTPAIKAVRESYHEAKIVAYINKDVRDLFENNGYVNQIISYYGGYKRFLRNIIKLRRYKFDLILILHGNEPQATPSAYLTGAPFIVKLPNTSRYRFLLSNRLPIYRWEDLGHGVEQRLKVAKLAGCQIKDRKMVLPVDDEDANAVSQFLNKEGLGPSDCLVGFQVGASTVSRMWFPERFIELGKRLIAAHPAVKILITGSPVEKKYCEFIGRQIGERVVVSAGRIPLRQVPALTKRLNILLTGDTGIMHVAIAVGTPVVALYAVSDWKRSGPYYDLEKHKVIQKWKTCDLCLSKKCKYQKCMENISVDEVYKVVLNVLRENRKEV